MGDIYTIGHSNRSFGEFIALLRGHGIKTLVDIRTIPRSRAFPHFDRENLEKALPVEGIRYVWMKSLGGLRRPLRGFDSPNMGLSSPGFRAYADFMSTDEFRKAVKVLFALASSSLTACMCAEAVYWRCHRRLLSDYLVAQGVQVYHIMGSKEPAPHKTTRGACVSQAGL
ncbi:MAG: DUF488 domain-containing protein, partial [Deltaproteobacteria bacterium]|nr:DUF488 domain-containing protein [Deltaproteobacteria bacterium]